jgi:benzodiazapine receptor
MDLWSIIVLIGFVGISFLAAATGAMFRPGEWYEQLRKPSWRPPNWVFPPAWTLLYLTIAVSGWLVWRTSGFAGAAFPFAIYLVQLVLNASWSPIFFGMHRPGLAFIEVVMLWLSIIATIAVFHRVNAVAAYLLLPYLAWVTFAAALNLTIWHLNRGPLSQSGTNVPRAHASLTRWENSLLSREKFPVPMRREFRRNYLSYCAENRARFRSCGRISRNSLYFPA